MDVWHNPYRHLLNLGQSLSQDGKPIGFFLSAGCPHARPIDCNAMTAGMLTSGFWR